MLFRLALIGTLLLDSAWAIPTRALPAPCKGSASLTTQALMPSLVMVRSAMGRHLRVRTIASRLSMQTFHPKLLPTGKGPLSKAEELLTRPWMKMTSPGSEGSERSASEISKLFQREALVIELAALLNRPKPWIYHDLRVIDDNKIAEAAFRRFNLMDREYAQLIAALWNEPEKAIEELGRGRRTSERFNYHGGLKVHDDPFFDRKPIPRAVVNHERDILRNILRHHEFVSIEWGYFPQVNYWLPVGVVGEKTKNSLKVLMTWEGKVLALAESIDRATLAEAHRTYKRVVLLQRLGENGELVYDLQSSVHFKDRPREPVTATVESTRLLSIRLAGDFHYHPLALLMKRGLTGELGGLLVRMLNYNKTSCPNSISTMVRSGRNNSHYVH